MKYTTTKEIELAIARWFGTRQNIIVPNVSWGMFNHELDLCVISKAGYCTEVEIKISKADCKADLNKRHKHSSNLISKLYFAMPVSIYEACVSLIPDHAGILVVYDNGFTYEKKKPTIINRKKLNNAEILKIARLGTMRIWNLKETMLRNNRN